MADIKQGQRPGLGSMRSCPFKRAALAAILTVPLTLLHGTGANADDTNRSISGAEKAEALSKIQGICAQAAAQVSARSMLQSQLNNGSNSFYDQLAKDQIEYNDAQWRVVKKECDSRQRVDANDNRIIALAEKIEALARIAAANSAAHSNAISTKAMEHIQENHRGQQTENDLSTAIVHRGSNNSSLTRQELAQVDSFAMEVLHKALGGYGTVTANGRGHILKEIMDRLTEDFGGTVAGKYKSIDLRGELPQSGQTDDTVKLSYVPR